MEYKNKCSICLDIINNNFHKQKCCSNYFHLKCLKRWYQINSRCPLCRSEPKIITFDEYLEIRTLFKKIKGYEYLNIINNYLMVFYYTSKNKKKIIYKFLLFFKLLNHIMAI